MVRPAFLPEQASEQATQVDLIFFALLAFSTFFFLLIVLLLFFFILRYHKSTKANRRNAPRNSNLLEVAWMVIPAAMVIAIGVWGTVTYSRMQRPPEDVMEIYAVGKQWMWKLQHQTGHRENNELHIPVGQPVRVRLASQDVIHSFYIPEFRIKKDAVPGFFTQTWFTPTREGEYHLYCAEYCGTDHAEMRGTVYVMPPEDFDAWLRSNQPDRSMAAQGKQLFMEYGCSGCHVQGLHPAPRLEGLFGRLVTLQNGSAVPADEQYIRDSILLPQKHIVAGYTPVMPSFQGQITEGEIFEIIEYIKSISDDEKGNP